MSGFICRIFQGVYFQWHFASQNYWYQSVEIMPWFFIEFQNIRSHYLMMFTFWIYILYIYCGSKIREFSKRHKIIWYTLLHRYTTQVTYNVFNNFNFLRNYLYHVMFYNFNMICRLLVVVCQPFKGTYS